MSQPYENVYLGNFILTLGYIAGHRNVPLNRIAIEQLQQTPGDTPIGDLVAAWEGRNFIFEFKRHEANVRWEFRKANRARLLEMVHKPKNSAETELLSTSTAGHFMCFPISVPIVTLTFMPYARIVNAPRQDMRRRIDLTTFCTNLLDGAPKFGLPYREFSAYLSQLDEIAGVDSSGSGGGNAVIMNISKEGAISIVEAENLHVLAKSLDMEKPGPVLEIEKTKSFGIGD